ncbi:MAG: CHAT domain-containing protein [Cyanobacteria bacterium P01_G01_bin.54]
MGIAQAATQPTSAPVELGAVLPDETQALPGEGLVAQNTEAKEAERLLNEGVALFQEGTAESLRAAIEKFEAAIVLYEAANDFFGEALTRFKLGHAYSDLDFNFRALSAYEESLKVWQELARQRTGENLQIIQQLEADTLRNIGVINSALGEGHQALVYYNQALSMFQAVGDRNGEAKTLNNIGFAHSALGEKYQALEYYDQALSVFQEVGDRSGEAQVLNNMGAIYSAIGEKSQALDYYNQSLSLKRLLGDRSGEATTLNNIGRVYDALGENKQALDYYSQTLPIRRAVGDRNGEAITLNNIGAAYDTLGERTRALDYYNQALPMRRAVGDRNGEAITLNNIGAVYDALGEKHQALDYYNQALLLFQTVGNRSGEAVAFTNIGDVYAALGDNSQAIDYYNQALPLVQAVGNISAEANILRNKAWVQHDQNDLTAALTSIEAAIQLIEKLRSNITSSKLRQTFFAEQQDYYQFYIDLLMQLHQQNPDAGYDQQAFHISERSRARTLIELLTEAQLNFRDSANPDLLQQERALLAQLVAQEQRLSQRLGNTQTLAERDQIRQDYTTATNQINSELDTVINQLKRQNPAYTDLKYPEPLDLAQVQQQVLDDNTVLLQYSLHPDQSYLWLISKDGYTTHILPPQQEIEAAVRRFNRRIQSSNCHNTQNPQFCVDRLLPAGTTLYDQILAPIAQQIQGKRLLIVPDGVLHYVPFAAIPLPSTSPLPRGTEGDQASASQIPPATPTPLLRGFWAAAKDLKVALSQPLAASPPFIKGEGGDQASVQNPTHYIPLLTQHEIVHAPSATAIATQRQNFRNRPPAPKDLAILADPVFSPNDPRVTGSTATPPNPLSETPPLDLNALLGRSALSRSLCLPSDGINRLPGTRQEAKALQRHSPDALTALDFDASQDWLNAAPLEQYQTLFFSTHGCIDSQNPELSGLVLTLVNEKGQEKPDGFLRLNEIFNLQLNADLVVLSACQTGLGETIKGEGMVGMTRGFMYAGAERVVVSLWDVDDAATAQLMNQFYATLKQGTPAAAALREAQLALWEQYTEPRLWAAFTLQGEWLGD